jgi:hypothetical protein
VFGLSSSFGISYGQIGLLGDVNSLSLRALIWRRIDLCHLNFKKLGETGGEMISMAQLLAETSGDDAEVSLWDTPFLSMDALHEACPSIPQSRELTSGLEEGFMSIKDSLKVVLDPLTQPLSWALDEALWVMRAVPEFLTIR